MIYWCHNECGRAFEDNKTVACEVIQTDNIKRKNKSTTKICLREFLPDVLELNTEMNLELSSV